MLDRIQAKPPPTLRLLHPAQPAAAEAAEWGVEQEEDGTTKYKRFSIQLYMPPILLFLTELVEL